jgi:hypothetical protein
MLLTLLNKKLNKLVKVIVLAVALIPEVLKLVMPTEITYMDTEDIQIKDIVS